MPHDHRHAFDSADAVARLELEGEVASGIDAEAIARCRRLLDADTQEAPGGGPVTVDRHDAPGAVPVRRVVDLGCGPGVAAAALAAAFPEAEVVAADNSVAMVERAGAGGVTAVRLDLDGDLSSLGEFDLGWSSMAVHHAADEPATIARFASLVRPGGVLCLLEHAAPTTVRLADDLGRPGLWARVDAARTARQAHVPGDPDAYPAWLRDAGLELAADEVLADTLDATRGPVVAQFAADRLHREARGLEDHLADADLAALRDLGDTVSGDVEVRISRRLLLARRP